MNEDLPLFETALTDTAMEAMRHATKPRREALEEAFRKAPRTVLQNMFRPVSAPVADWLRSIGTPSGVVEVMSTYWFGEGGGISFFEMHGDVELQSAWEEWERRRGEQLLTIGSCPNGDDIVLDLRSGGIAYLTHESPDDETLLREAMRVVAPSLGAFAIGATKNVMPSDYYDG